MPRPRIVVAALVATLALAGCTPSPEPTPSPTGFASEEEAFAAAEATYRAYVDALNQVDTRNPETFEPVYSWLAGEALAASKKTFSAMHADDWQVAGVSVLASARPVTHDNSGVIMAVCLDVSQVEVTDASGASVVSPERVDVQPLLIALSPADSATGLVVSSSETDGDRACD
ncbi:hypothetical protein [Microbacterium telephonicum]|uniref:hypothetical protein n=1 Tax=Microbacterium telephonicum TaxID=1714841 RepID=UPI000EAC6381|nr:hypothetical protein [Microbacterium telephonicum]